jgi:hypothetical protein
MLSIMSFRTGASLVTSYYILIEEEEKGNDKFWME